MFVTTRYSYWNPEQYITIWTTPLPLETICLALGHSVGRPKIDLLGDENFVFPQQGDSNGIIIRGVILENLPLTAMQDLAVLQRYEMGH